MLESTKHLLARAALALSLSIASSSHAAWPRVEPMKWDGISVDDFDDTELDIPYLLEHFHTVANAVVEEGPTRGFLAIKVNREPKDNEPYNARIQENNLALAYFYATKRAWNPYYGSEAVKVRLEAMLDYWCKIQHPESGLFSEYTPNNFSLAPTGFGVAHISRTLELLTGGGPTIDKAVLDRTIAAQRKAVMALLTRDDVFEWTYSWSNQHTGVFRAALSLQKLLPDDAELREATRRGAVRAVKVSQSPAGFLYESAGPDIGYSSVHERFMTFAYPLLEKHPDLMKIFEPSETLWGRWLEYNLVPQPGEPLVYLVNGAPHTRTSHAIQKPRYWAQAEHHENWVAFQMTGAEREAQLKAQRDQLRANWPKTKALTVPSAYAYQPTPLFFASTDIRFWTPDKAGRDAAIAKLPCFEQKPFNRQAHDARRDWTFTYVQRPTYYATFTSGKPQARQFFGIGLIWNERMGTVLQSVAGTDWSFGTRVKGEPPRESKPVIAELKVNKSPVSAPNGWGDLPGGDLDATYALEGGGMKQTLFKDAMIEVAVKSTGDFVETLPLVVRKDDQVRVSGNTVEIVRGAGRFVIEFAPGATAQLGEQKEIGAELPGFARMLVRLSAKDELLYTMRFGSN